MAAGGLHRVGELGGVGGGQRHDGARDLFRGAGADGGVGAENLAGFLGVSGDQGGDFVLAEAGAVEFGAQAVERALSSGLVMTLARGSVDNRSARDSA